MVFLEALNDEIIYNTGASSDISYKLLNHHIYDDLIRASQSDNVFVAGKILSKYYDDLNQNYLILLNSRSPIIKGMFLLYETALALDKFNNNHLKLSNIQFRHKILFPYLTYFLQQHLVETRKFLHYMIRVTYNDTKRNAQSIIDYHIKSIYLDQDVIKRDVLLTFLGNGLKTKNPLDVGNINAFYRSVFRQIFLYYFMNKRKIQTICTDFSGVENSFRVFATSTRNAIYRDVLYNIDVKRYYEESPLYAHLDYNFQIFKNIIINNELQDIYATVKANNSMGLNNNEYKVLKIYDDDIKNDEFIEKIRKLPIIFRLLKCVHLINPKTKAYNEMVIKPELLKIVIRDELMYPFRNLFDSTYLLPILDRVSENFTKSILSGEYINLLTLSPIKITQMSFIDQARKFVKICLEDLYTTKN